VKIWLTLTALFRRKKIEAEMAEELRLHLERRVEENVASGMSPEDARYAALRKFGGVEQVKEDCREQRAGVWLEQLSQDFNYACRQLLKAPGFAATVVLTLALGIGACTIVFTAVNSTLLRPLAGQPVDRDVIVHETLLPQRPQMQLSPPAFLDLEREAKSFEILAAWTGLSVNLESDTEPLQLQAAAITPRVLDIWGTQAALGRSFLPDEFKGGEKVVMLSHALWQRAFGGSPSVIGRAINIDGAPCTVVGVIQPEFARYGSDIEIWVPLVFSEQQRTQQRGAHYLQTMGRLKRGVSLAQAQAELDVLAANLAQQYPDTNKGVGLLVRDFGAYINRSLAPMLYVLLGAVGCVLLIACANVANLLLARATTRQREISIRSALGAGRGRIMRQLLVESMVLAALGGAAGILLAQWGLRFVRVYGPAAGTDLARLAYIELDPGVLAFTVGFSLLTGVVFGLAPAWLGSRVDLSEALKQSSRGNSETGVRGRLRGTLVVLEVSLALVLLAGAGLLVRSFAQLAQLDPGFVPERVATMRIDLNGKKYPLDRQRLQFTDALLERIKRLPGVEAAAVTTLSPSNNSGPLSFDIAGRPPGKVQPGAVPYSVTPDYFNAMGVRLLRGRGFDDRDGVSGPLVFVINETLARQFFGNEDPLGQRLSLKIGRNPEPVGEIVGIVRDVMQGMPGTPSPPQLYVPWAAFNWNRFFVMVRTAGDPAALLPLLKAEVHAIDGNQPVGASRTLEELMDNAIARTRLMLVLLVTFGLVALVIAAVGIYGVMAYSVSQRTMEFGIRMALGASRRDVLREVMRRGMRTVAVGVLLGVGAALLLGKVVGALLYNTSPRDPFTLVAIVLLLLAVALIACLLPARRATKVDPMVALRAE
jgi:putative ABC transport system permease protein